jgi:uridine kinase
VSVRGCLLVGIDGTHACGKTTLVHALTAHYRERGVLVDCVGERPAAVRSSKTS